MRTENAESFVARLQGVNAIYVASTGGHLAQLEKLDRNIFASGEESLWLTFRTSQSESLLSGRRVAFVPYIPSRGIAQLLRSFPTVLQILRKHKSHAIVVSTGAAIAALALPLAVLLGKEAHYVESVSRFDGPSLTGRILARVPRIHLHTQHAKWADSKWVHDVSVLDHFRTGLRRPVDKDRNLRVFVTLGTIRPFRFDALVDRVKEIVPPGTEVVWQLGVTARTDLVGVTHEEMSASDMDREMLGADCVISHAGVGTALRALELGIHPILVPRRSAHNEHVDSHQNQIARELDRRQIALHRQVDQLNTADLFEAAARTVDVGRRSDVVGGDDE